MFSFRQKEACGRFVPKPESKSVKDDVELYEDAVPITQQIENLRTKISLQERYNAALQDNLEESTKGSYQALRNMFQEVWSLRMQLKEAVNKEKWAVNNALRSHRLFQLALKYTPPGAAVDWMEDKLFDYAKILNNHIDRLVTKRKKLEDTEVNVTVIEKWPIPGSLPWEVRLSEKQKQAEVAQANVRLRLECARVMRNAYKSIRQKLKSEKDLYAPIIRNLSSQLTIQISELKNLKKMLGYAQKFQRDALETLEWTEKEASANRKQRRAIIGKMRKEMHKMIHDEQQSFLTTKQSVNTRKDSRTSSTGMGSTTGGGGGLFQYESIILADDAETEQAERLAQKKAQIDTYNDNAALLVDVMKVPNLTHIPGRMDDVLKLAKILKAEIESKENLKNLLINQRDQLTQLFCVIRYTGNKELEENNMVIRDYQNTLKDLEKAIERQRNGLNQDSSLKCDLQMGISSLLQRIEGNEKKSIHIQNSDHLFYVLPMFLEKLKVLCDSSKELKKELHRRRSFERVKSKTNTYTTPARFVRVGETTLDQEGSDEDDFEDYRVPGRQELKLQSEKIYHQGILRRGFAAARRDLKSKGKRKSDSDSKSTAGGTGPGSNI